MKELTWSFDTTEPIFAEVPRLTCSEWFNITTRKPLTYYRNETFSSGREIMEKKILTLTV